MPQNPPGSPSRSNYDAMFERALYYYKKKTGKVLASDPKLSTLESYDSPEAVLNWLRKEIPGFDQSGPDETSMKWLDPALNFLCNFSLTIGSIAGLAFPPSGIIFGGIRIFLIAFQGFRASQAALSEIFRLLDNFFRRLQIYIEIPQTEGMTNIIVTVMTEFLITLALVTREIKQGKFLRVLKEVAGMSDIKDAQSRLENLMKEEDRMANAQGLREAHRANKAMKAIGDVLIGANEQMELEKWLSPPDLSTNYKTARDAHHDGTAVWFTKGTVFENWKKSGSLLWIHGKPGSGKSVLTSVIIEDMKGISNAGHGHMAYFFFDLNDKGDRKRNARGLLSSILAQLSCRSKSFHDSLRALYTAHDNTHLPSISDLTQCLESILRAAGDMPVYLIIDALDECPNAGGAKPPRHLVLELLKKLVELNLPNLHLCVTSRPEVDIRTSLESLRSKLYQICLHDQSGQTEAIAEFVKAVVKSDQNIRRWKDEDKELVIKTLLESADGMFRWVSCKLEILRQLLRARVRDILPILSEWSDSPQPLDKTYEQILQQIPHIPSSNREHAHRLLQCLAVAVRPLRVEELAEVLAIDFCAERTTPLVDESLRWGWEDQEQAVLSVCSSLVVIVEESGSRLVRFSHFSIGKFLISNRLAVSKDDSLRYYHIGLGDAHTTMAQACLGVLLRLESHMDRESIGSYPLANYAGQHFVEHASFGNVLSHVADGVDKLLDADKPHFDTWVWLQIGDWDPDCWYISNQRNTLPPSPNPTPHPSYPPRVAPLYYVAALGHHCLAEHLILNCSEDLHVKDDKGYAPLHIAVLANKVKVLQLIIKHTTDVDHVRDTQGQTALHLAVDNGLFEVGRMLIEHDACIVNARNNKGQTALHLASRHHNGPFVELLLNHKADIDAQDDDNMAPLHFTVSRTVVLDSDFERGRAVVELLLGGGASLQVQNNKGETPLQAASVEPRFMELLSKHVKSGNKT